MLCFWEFEEAPTLNITKKPAFGAGNGRCVLFYFGVFDFTSVIVFMEQRLARSRCLHVVFVFEHFFYSKRYSYLINCHYDCQ